MSINELKKLSPRELNKFMSNITAKEIKEMLNNENLGGGLSKYNKDTLVDILLDLIYETNDSGLMDTLKPKKARKNKKAKIKENKKDTFLETIPKVAKDILKNLVVDPEQYYEEYLEQHEEEEERLEVYNDMMKESVRESFFREKIFDMLIDKTEEITKEDYADYIFNDDVDRVLSEEASKIGKVIHRQLVKYYHPDKATGDTEKFRNIQADYERFKIQIKEF